MIRKLLNFLFLTLFIFNYHFLNGKDIKLDWKGKIEFENNVKIIKNPVEPLFGRSNFELEEDLCINFGKDKNDFFEWASKIELDNENNIYVLDSGKCVILKFDNRGKYLYRIGRKGNGPGEFQKPKDLFINKKGIIYGTNE